MEQKRRIQNQVARHTTPKSTTYSSVVSGRQRCLTPTADFD